MQSDEESDEEEGSGMELDKGIKAMENYISVLDEDEDIVQLNPQQKNLSRVYPDDDEDDEIIEVAVTSSAQASTSTSSPVRPQQASSSRQYPPPIGTGRPPPPGQDLETPTRPRTRSSRR